MIRSSGNWKIKKQNGAVYGPANTATIRKWIQENRVLADNYVSPEAVENWQPAKSLAQFADLFVDEATSAEKQCLYCGTALISEVVICTNCGTNLRTGKKIADMKIKKPERKRRGASVGRKKVKVGSCFWLALGFIAVFFNLYFARLSAWPCDHFL